MRNKAEALRRGTSSSRTVSPSMHIQRDTFGQACIRSTNLSCRFFSTCTLSTVRKYPDDWLVEPVATDNSTRRVVREKLVVNSVCRRGQFSSNENWSSQPDKGKRACSKRRRRTCSFNLTREEARFMRLKKYTWWENLTFRIWLVYRWVGFVFKNK